MNRKSSYKILLLKFVLFTSVFLISKSIIAQTTRSTRGTNTYASMSWSSTGCGGGAAGAPIAGDNIEVCAGHTLTIASTPGITFGTITIRNTGILQFNGNRTLACNTLIVDMGGTFQFTNAGAAPKTLTISAGGTITVNGTFDMTSSEGDITMGAGSFFNIGANGSFRWSPNTNTAGGATLFTNSTENFNATSTLIINRWYNLNTVGLGENVTGNFGNVTIDINTGGTYFDQEGYFSTKLVQGTLTIGGTNTTEVIFDDDNAGGAVRSVTLQNVVLNNGSILIGHFKNTCATTNYTLTMNSLTLNANASFQVFQGSNCTVNFNTVNDLISTNGDFTISWGNNNVVTIVIGNDGTGNLTFGSGLTTGDFLYDSDNNTGTSSLNCTINGNLTQNATQNMYFNRGGSGNVIVDINGTFTVSNTGWFLCQDGSIVANSGTIDVDANDLSVSNGALIINYGGTNTATFDIINTATISGTGILEVIDYSPSTSAATMTVGTTLTVSGTATYLIAFSNGTASLTAGSISFTGGTLDLQDFATNTKTSTLIVNGNFNMTGGIFTQTFGTGTANTTITGDFSVSGASQTNAKVINNSASLATATINIGNDILYSNSNTSSQLLFTDHLGKCYVNVNRNFTCTNGLGTGSFSILLNSNLNNIDSTVLHLDFDANSTGTFSINSANCIAGLAYNDGTGLGSGGTRFNARDVNISNGEFYVNYLSVTTANSKIRISGTYTQSGGIVEFLDGYANNNGNLDVIIGTINFTGGTFLPYWANDNTGTKTVSFNVLNNFTANYTSVNDFIALVFGSSFGGADNNVALNFSIGGRLNISGLNGTFYCGYNKGTSAINISDNTNSAFTQSNGDFIIKRNTGLATMNIIGGFDISGGGFLFHDGIVATPNIITVNVNSDNDATGDFSHTGGAINFDKCSYTGSATHVLNIYSPNYTVGGAAATYMGKSDIFQIRDFETVPATPTLGIATGTPTTITGSSTASDVPASSPFFSSTNTAWAITNATETVTYSPVTITGITNCSVEFRLAAFGLGLSTRGVDPTDIVTVSISINGGAFFSTLRILGPTANNAYWAYTATGVASTTYDGDASPVDFQPAGTGSRTTDGYTYIRVNIPDGTTTVQLRISAITNSNFERWCIDDVTIKGVNSGTRDIFGAINFKGTSTTFNRSTVNHNIQQLKLTIDAGTTVDASSSVQPFQIASNATQAYISTNALSVNGTLIMGTNKITATGPSLTGYYSGINVGSGGEIRTANSSGFFDGTTNSCLQPQVFAADANYRMDYNLNANSTITYNAAADVLQVVTGKYPNAGVASDVTSITTQYQYGNLKINHIVDADPENDYCYLTGNNAFVRSQLSLTSGVLCTRSYKLSMLAGSSVSPVEGSATSFVDGKIEKIGNTAFTFPTGDIQSTTLYWAPCGISNPTLATDAFSAHYTFKSVYDSLALQNWATSPYLTPTIDHVSGMEFWNIERTSGASQPSVTLYWKNAVNSDIAHTGPVYDDLSDLTVSHWCSTHSKWEDMTGSATSPGGYPTGEITSATAFTDGYSPIAFGSKTGINPLPVSLLSLVATCAKDVITIKWTTLSETNNDYFTLEKSSDGINWDLLAFINGAGNSNSQNDYTYIDINGKEQNYYRLKQTDFNGKFSYSEVIAANCSSYEPVEDFSNLVIFDNPKDNNIKINFNGGKQGDSYQVHLVDQLGRKLYIEKYIKSNDINENISISKNKLASGIYNLIISNSKSIKVKQIALINH